MSHFEKGFDYSLKNEGGYVNHPADRGGPTNHGITQGTLARWRGHSVSAEDVKNLGLWEAKAIYKKNYWDSLNLDGVTSAPIAICLFDLGIVRGTGIPGKYAQEICNSHGGAKLAVDRVIGPKTLAAVNGMDPGVFVTQFAHKAKLGFEAIVAYNPSQRVFLKGWTNRANRYLTLI